MKIQLLAIATAAFFSTTTLAKAPSWDQIEVGYTKGDIDDLSEVSPSGFAIGGSKLLGENVFVLGSYSMLSDDYQGVDLDLDQASVGLGYRLGLNETTDAYVTASYEYIELSGSGNGNSISVDDNGYGIGIGVRSRLTDNFEVDGSIGYIDIADESETAFAVSGYYYFTDAVAIGAHYSSTADVSLYGVSLRYSF